MKTRLIKYLLLMIFMFFFSSILCIFVLMAPLEKFKGLGHLELTQPQALMSKILGVCTLISISIASAFKVYELSLKFRVAIFGPKMKFFKKIVESYLSAMFTFTISSFLLYKLLTFIWPYSDQDLLIVSLKTNLASILSLLVGGLIAINSFRSAFIQHNRTNQENL